MSLASSLKRVMLVVGATALALGAGLAFAPVLVPAEVARQAVIAELTRRAGAPVAIAGPVTVSVLPQLSVRLDGISIGGETPLITAEAAAGTLRLVPLLLGRVSISDYTLIRPRIAVTVEADGSSNWDEALRAVRRSALARDGAMPDFRIVQGEALIVDDKTRQRVEVSGLDLAVSWPGYERQANLSGRFVLRGEPVEINAVVARPVALLAGEASGLKMRLSAPALQLGFEGRMEGAAWMANGTMTIESPSLRQVLRWLGQNPGYGPALAAFALKGEVRARPNLLAFSSVNAELDGNVANGALTVNLTGERPHIHGTLDAERVVATPYFVDMTFTQEAEQGWSRRPIDLTAVAACDIDLRLSAREVMVGGVRLGRSGASLTSRNGRLTLTLGESQAYGGSLRGALVMVPQADGAEIKASLNVQRARLGEGLSEWFGFRRLEGLGNAQVSLEARGSSIADFVRTAAGQATLTAVEGTVRGFNAEAVLKRLERRPLAGVGVDARSGRTPYERLAATVRIADGKAITNDMVLDGKIVRVNIRGTAQLPQRELDLTGIATLKRPGEAGFELPFVVQGSWDDPFVLPDPESLIRRSGAAAPLRDVTRDRDALRAVLDAINRQGLQEAGETPPSPAPAFAPFPPPPPSRD